MPKENPELEQSNYQLPKEITQNHEDEIFDNIKDGNVITDEQELKKMGYNQQTVDWIIKNNNTKYYPDNILIRLFERFYQRGCDMDGYDIMINLLSSSENKYYQSQILKSMDRIPTNQLTSLSVPGLIICTSIYSKYDLVNIDKLIHLIGCSEENPALLVDDLYRISMKEILPILKDKLHKNWKFYYNQIFNNILTLYNEQFNINETDIIIERDSLINGFIKCIKYNLIDQEFEVDKDTIGYIYFSNSLSENELRILQKNQIKLRSYFEESVHPNSKTRSLSSGMGILFGYDYIKNIINNIETYDRNIQRMSPQEILSFTCCYADEAHLIEQMLTQGCSIHHLRRVTEKHNHIPKNFWKHCIENNFDSYEVYQLYSSNIDLDLLGSDITFQDLQMEQNHNNYLKNANSITPEFLANQKKTSFSKKRKIINNSREKLNSLSDDHISHEEFSNLFGESKLKRYELDQGDIGDCYLIALLNSLKSKQQFELIMRSMIKKSHINNEEIFEVKIPAFDPNGERITVTQEDLDKREVNKNNKGIDGYQIIEVAYMKKYHPETLETQEHDGNNLIDATIKLLGKQVIKRSNTYRDMSDPYEFGRIVKQLAEYQQGKYIIELGSSINSQEPITNNTGSIKLFSRHAYSIKKVTQKGEEYFVTITNPHKTKHKRITLNFEELFNYFTNFKLVELDLDHISGKNQHRST